MSDEIECCMNCRYLKEYEVKYDNADVDHECRRFPQQVYLGPDGEIYSAFPGARLEAWCGEWKEREPSWMS